MELLIRNQTPCIIRKQTPFNYKLLQRMTVKQPTWQRSLQCNRTTTGTEPSKYVINRKLVINLAIFPLTFDQFYHAQASHIINHIQSLVNEQQKRWQRRFEIADNYSEYFTAIIKTKAGASWREHWSRSRWNRVSNSWLKSNHDLILKICHDSPLTNDGVHDRRKS